jgi:two-component system LytT family response regulator
MEHIPIQQHSGLVKINPSTIIRIEGSNTYSKIYFTNRGPLMVSKILKWFEHILINHGFIRVHKSHLINGAFICRKSKAKPLRLQNGEVVPVSRKLKNIFNLQAV